MFWEPGWALRWYMRMTCGLDEAMDALQKAAALVEAARTDTETTTDPVSSHTQHEFDRHRAKALASIENAMDHIAAAAEAVDSDGSK